jgi:glyoxylase-like metal-dependent hydrolase (beta-lactamase superfamily II)
MSTLSEQIGEGVHWIRVGVANVYLVRLPQGAALIDAGLPSAAPAIERALEELGVRRAGRGAGALCAVLLTHRHLDHAGGAAALAAAHGAEVLIHEADAAAVEGRERLTPARPGLLGRLVEPLVAFSDGKIFRYRPTPVRALRDGERYADALTLVHTPGHTPGSSAWLLDAERIVFGGDAAMNFRRKLRHPSTLFSLDARAVRRSQRRLAELDAELYAFGHGPPLERGAAALERLAADQPP